MCKEVFWDDKGYDTWVKGTYFKDIIDATWISRNGKPYENKKQPHVLSLYCPLKTDVEEEIMNLKGDQAKEKTIVEDTKKKIRSRSGSLGWWAFADVRSLSSDSWANLIDSP